MKNDYEEEYEDEDDEELDTGFWVQEWTYCKTNACSKVWL